MHLAFGMAYPETYEKNKKQGNKSALHWDIVKESVLLAAYAISYR